MRPLNRLLNAAAPLIAPVIAAMRPLWQRWHKPASAASPVAFLLARVTGVPWTGGPPQTILFVGQPDHLQHLNAVFFEGHGHVDRQEPLNAPPSTIAPPGSFLPAEWMEDVSVVVRQTTRTAPPASDAAFRMPPYVDVVIPVEPGVADPLKIVPRSLKTRLRAAMDEGFTPALTRDPGDYDTFYNDLHAPMTRHRHACNQYLRPLETVRPKGDHWALLWAEQNGRRLAAMELHFPVLPGGIARGVRSGFAQEILNDPQRYAQLTAFLYTHAWLETARRGHIGLNAGLTASALGAGILVFKVRWKATVHAAADDIRWDVSFHGPDTESLQRQWLCHRPLIIDDDGQRLVGLAAQWGDRSPDAILSEHKRSGLADIRVLRSHP